MKALTVGELRHLLNTLPLNVDNHTVWVGAEGGCTRENIGQAFVIDNESKELQFIWCETDIDIEYQK